MNINVGGPLTDNMKYFFSFENISYEDASPSTSYFPSISFDEVNGISISPKKEFNIVKIWFKNDDFEYKKYFQSENDSLISLENSLYKKHEI